MGVWKVTYVAGSSSAPFCCSTPRLAREPLDTPFISLSDAGSTNIVDDVEGTATGVFVTVLVGRADAVIVGVLVGGIAVVVNRGVAVNVLVGTLLKVGVLVGVSLVTGVFVGVSVVSVPVGDTVTAGVEVTVLVGTLVVVADSARAITSTSPRAAAFPLTELN